MPTTLYAKTAAAELALAERSRGLLPRQRQLLIMVDGKRTAAELGQIFNDAPMILEQLAAAGFIAAVAASTGQPATVQPAAPDVQAQADPPGRARPALTIQALPDAKRRAVRALTDAMGPTADSACLRIESAKTVEDFEMQITRAAALLRSVRGAADAQDFQAAFGSSG